jgi:hypothetical protein
MIVPFPAKKMKNHDKIIFKKVVLAVHERGYNPLCEGLGGCRVNRTSYQKQGSLLRPLPIPRGPWHCVCMDFITSLPEPQGYDAILVMVGRFAKLAHMVPIVEPQPRWRPHSQFSKVGEGTTGCQK